jgi:hypothetical protein
MKNFLTALGLFLVVLLIWLLPSSVLDKAAPLNVNIDIEFIKSLKNPAYGSNGQ